VYCYYPQQQYSGTSISILLISSAIVFWHQYIHIATILSNSILAPVYPSCHKLSARTFHPFLSHSLLATLPAYHPLLGITFFFLLFLACSKGIKMDLINSKRTSVCIAKVDVIKDLILLPLSLFHPSPGLNHPHFYYIPSPIIIYWAKSSWKFIKFSSLRPMCCVFLRFINIYRSSPS